jgi:hypothetical protein
VKDPKNFSSGNFILQIKVVKVSGVFLIRFNFRGPGNIKLASLLVPKITKKASKHTL